MVEIIGANNTAKCFTDVVETAAFEQIKAVCDEPAFSDSKIRRAWKYRY